MELGLNHLAPYLPYELCLKADYFNTPKSFFLVVENNSNSFGNGLNIKDALRFNAKPLLRPLSQFGESDDLRKVHEFIGFGKWCDAYDEYFKAWFDDTASIDVRVLQAPYEIFQYFLSEHYDVFSLIENGLATIKE